MFARTLTAMPALMVAGIVAAQTTHGSSAPATSTLGELITLEQRAIESVATAIDDANRAHVVLVTQKPRELEHLSIGRDGEIEREVISNRPPPGAPSAAFAADGRLVVAIGSHLYGRSEAGWAEDAGAPPCETLVRAGMDLACAFVVKNSAPGARGHWEFYILGAAQGCCLPFAWYFQTHKLVVARQSANGQWLWTVMDGKSPRDVAGYAIGGAKDGTIHALYNMTDYHAFMGAAKDPEQFYARIGAGWQHSTSDPQERAAKAPADYAQASGQPLGDWLHTGLPPSATPPCLAIDWQSGDATLLSAGEAYRAPSAGDAVRTRHLQGLRCGSAGDFAADGAGRIHQLYGHPRRDAGHKKRQFDLCYRVSEQGAWSPAVDLGPFDGRNFEAAPGVAARLGWTPRIAAVGDNRALGVWVHPNGNLVARWIENAPASGDAASPLAAADSTCAPPPESPAGSNQRLVSPRRSGSQIDAETAQRLVATDEHIERIVESAVWYGETATALGRARHLIRGDAREGTLVVTGKGFVFAIDEPTASRDESQRVLARLDYSDIARVQARTLVFNHWVQVRTRDGKEHYFAVMLRSSGRVDRDGTIGASELLQSRVGAIAQ